MPPGPGGIATSTYHLALELTRAGDQVRVLAPQDHVRDDEIAFWAKKQPFETIRLGQRPFRSLSLLSTSFFFLRTILSFRPDVVVALGRRALWVAGRVAPLCRRPLVVLVHGTAPSTRSRSAQTRDRRAVAAADHVIAASHFVARQLERSDFRPRALAVITPGADAALFRPLPPEELPQLRDLAGAIAPENRLLATIGPIAHAKGQDLVVRALPAILRAAPETHFLLIGRPEESAPLLELASDLGVANHVHVLGRLGPHDLVNMINACDVIIQAQRQTPEGDGCAFGRAAMEAALCAKPVVVTAGSGLEEAVLDNVTGIVVPPEDPAAIAEAAVSLLHDDALRRRLGQKALERARAEFSWRRRGAEIRAVIEKVAAEARRG